MADAIVRDCRPSSLQPPGRARGEAPAQAHRRDKQALSERDICTKYHPPALRNAGSNELTQMREEVEFTKGRIIVRGKLVDRMQPPGSSTY